MKKFAVLIVVLASCSVLTACSERIRTIKGVEKTLNIEHAFLPANTAYTPGNIFWEHDHKLQIACEPATTIKMSPADVKKNIRKFEITDTSVKKDNQVKINFALSSSEKSVLKGAGVDAKYEDISSMILEFKNGSQYELFKGDGTRVTYADIMKGIKNAECKDNITTILLAHPYANFFVGGIIYGYDLKYSLELKQGTKMDVDIPEEVLKVAKIKLGVDYEKSSGTIVGGKGLFVGFNGLPADKYVKELTDGIDSEQMIKAFGKNHGEFDLQKSIDITDVVRETFFK